MMNFLKLILPTFLVLALSACQNKETPAPTRPMDPWAFRSVLDRKPRMLTLALDSTFYAAYDLSTCTLYKAWKGGVTMEGTAYTGKKNIQPTSWGTAYVSNQDQHFKWMAEIDGNITPVRAVSKGYVFRDNQITLKFAMIFPSGDTVQIEETPEFIRNGTGDPGFERSFKTSGMSKAMALVLHAADTTLRLNANATTRWVAHFKELPKQNPPVQVEEYDNRGRYWMEKSDCFTCHESDKNTVGPALRAIAQKYPDEKTARQYLVRKVQDGGSGVWGTPVMNPHPGLTENDIQVMLDYILSLRGKKEVETNVSVANQNALVRETTKPGYGAPLAGVHPGYDLQTIHPENFRPKVGGLAFLPDGRLLVTTWDTMGGVYLLDGVETGDSAKVTVKRIASGLAEPLGIEVVDGKIYVLQKQELTRLIDLDGDDIADEYQVVCNSWSASSDFHEFAFGLVFKDGYFYATLSMAMRLMSGEKQQPDRGKTIRIGLDGSYEAINYGLRTPNGIGAGIDGQLFVCDNQGEWLPANKLIHVKKGEFLGMQWGLPDTFSQPPRMSPPAIWLPENEIANSPSEPVLIPYGPYKGQMLHGDVTYGGIQRDFLEKVKGDYQGAVFRFTQGLEAGINRMRWGPDSALYIGGVGMVGGWSWKEKQYGLQKMKYNGTPVFDMLAVRATPRGFEIEFTEPMSAENEISAAGFFVQQWKYLSTPNYGGPKLDLQKVRITEVTLSPDRKKVNLQMAGLKKEYVVYFRLPEGLKNEKGQSLWSSEAWYTLNNIPD